MKIQTKECWPSDLDPLLFGVFRSIGYFRLNSLLFDAEYLVQGTKQGSNGIVLSAAAITGKNPSNQFILFACLFPDHTGIAQRGPLFEATHLQLGTTIDFEYFARFHFLIESDISVVFETDEKRKKFLSFINRRIPEI